MALQSTLIPARLLSQATYESIADFYYSQEGAGKLPAYCTALIGSVIVTCCIGVDILVNATLYVGKRLYHYRFQVACAHRQTFYEQDAKAHGTAIWRAIANINKIFKLIFIPFIQKSASIGSLTHEARLAREVYQKTRDRLQQRFRSLAHRKDRKTAQEIAKKSHTVKKNWDSLIRKSKLRQLTQLRQNCFHELRIEKFIQNRVTKNMQRFWRNKPDFSGAFGEWSKKHGKDYLAHAIYQQESVEKIFHDGQVVPAEMLFRQQQKVEHEVCGTDRGSVQFPNIDDDMRKKMLALPSTRQRITVNERGVWIDFETNWKFWQEAKALMRSLPEDSPFKKFYEGSFSIMRDQLCDPADRIDAILSAFFQAGLKEGKTKLELGLHCNSTRSGIVPWGSLKFNIYCAKNFISWEYGNVVVIRGNGWRIGVNKCSLPP